MRKALITGIAGHVGLHWRRYVVVDESLRRPADSGLLVGNAAKARQKLLWEPRTPFRAMVELMVETDLRHLQDTHLSQPDPRPHGAALHVRLIPESCRGASGPTGGIQA
jgi:GDP-D-mannose dehydratase